MGLIDSLLGRRIDSEKEWLKELRAASQDWFNQLTEPLLPLLTGEVNSRDPNVERVYREIAGKLIKEGFIVNAGDQVKNLFTEMGNRGIPLVSSRRRLQPLITDYLEAGSFLKRLVYGFNPDEARRQWSQFQARKERLLLEINQQLAHIG